MARVATYMLQFVRLMEKENQRVPKYFGISFVIRAETYMDSRAVLLHGTLSALGSHDVSEG